MSGTIAEQSQSDPVLGSWTQCRWGPAPDDPLAGAVSRIWDFAGTLTRPRERVFPNGMVEVVVQLDTPHRAVTPTTSEPFPPVCVDGLRTGSTVVEAPPDHCRVLGIRLHPGGALALLGTPLRDLTDTSVALHAVIGRAAEELAQRLDAAQTGSDRVRVAEEWTRRRMAHARGLDEPVASAVRYIDYQQGAGPLMALERVTGRTRARLTAAFHDQVGLSPKQYARIVRFRRAMTLLSQGAGSLSAVALMAGYYDQAHMNADFRAFAGRPPGSYLKALRYPGGTHVAEAAS